MRSNLIITAALAIIAAMLPGGINAATPDQIQKRHTKAYDYCLNSGDAEQGVQPAMNACAYDEYTRQDGRLNQAYIMVMKRQKPAAKNKLRLSQRAWIKGRDATCKEERDQYEGGSIAPLMFHECMANETIKRTLWLEQYH